MREPRKLKSLLIEIQSLSEKESLKIDYILNNLTKVSNLYGLRLSEEEKRLLRRFQNKNFGSLKMGNDLKTSIRPKFDN